MLQIINPLQEPDVSIIIPFSRKKNVLKTLESIAKQDFDLDTVEVLISGTGSSSIPNKYNLNIRTIDLVANYPPGKWRNLGTAKANGSKFIFLDDDCIADKNLIKYVIKELERPNIGAVTGKIIGSSNKYFARCVDFSNFYLYQSNKAEYRKSVCSAVLGVKKERFIEIGKFRADLRVGEDVDLSYRLTENGYYNVYQPKIVVFHDHGRDTLRKLLQYQYNNGFMSAFLLFSNYKPSLAFKTLKRLKHPLVYFMMSIGFALYNTIYALIINIKDNKKIFLYIACVFIAKYFYHLGVLRALSKRYSERR